MVANSSYQLYIRVIIDNKPLTSISVPAIQQVSTLPASTGQTRMHVAIVLMQLGSCTAVAIELEDMSSDS